VVLDDYDELVSNLRTQFENSKSPADKLRDRLAYAQKLRKSAEAAHRVSERLNRWMQRPGAEKKPFLSRMGQKFSLTFGSDTIELSTVEVESIFTWVFDHAKALRAHADKIEKEVAGE